MHEITNTTLNGVVLEVGLILKQSAIDNGTKQNRLSQLVEIESILATMFGFKHNEHQHDTDMMTLLFIAICKFIVSTDQDIDLLKNINKIFESSTFQSLLNTNHD